MFFFENFRKRLFGLRFSWKNGLLVGGRGERSGGKVVVVVGVGKRRRRRGKRVRRKGMIRMIIGGNSKKNWKLRSGLLWRIIVWL